LEGKPLYPIWRVTHRLTPTAELFQGYCLGDNHLITDVVIYMILLIKTRRFQNYSILVCGFIYIGTPLTGGFRETNYVIFDLE